jgi:RNA polymerase sigma factor (TIGR02999 family)
MPGAMKTGDRKSADEVLPLVYEELRKLAAHKLANEASDLTLQPTALVHEAWLRLTGNKDSQWDGNGHFFAAAAEAMRRILIERARRKNAMKRGAQFERVELDTVNLAETTDSATLLLIDEALEAFTREDAAAAELVKLRFFVGMTNEEAAQVLGISERTAKRNWTFARAWLHDRITSQLAGRGTKAQ